MAKINTRKAYQILIVVLFFAFISLISRSIIYLILSLTIAMIILFLISTAKKSVKEVAEKTNTTILIKENNQFLTKVLSVTALLGALIIGYGLLYFIEEMFLHQFISVLNGRVLPILIIAAGFSIIVISFYFMIKEVLTDKGVKGQ